MHFTIVSYTFPPSKDIGGRRWAKFSQHLLKNGHDVTVVCSGNLNEGAFYEKEFRGIKVITLRKLYPDWLYGHTKSLEEKLLYKLYTTVFSNLTKKNVFDRGIYWRKLMLNSLEKIHLNKSIDVLVVTGAPFSLLSYGAEFKSKHQEIQYIADLRDPWTWGSLFGIPAMPAYKKRYQEALELQTIKACDMLCYPTQNMGDFLSKKYPDFSSKLYLLPHAFDPEKFPQTAKSEIRKGFIYGGTLYGGIEEYINRLAEIVTKSQVADFNWEIYTGTYYPLIDANFANGRVKTHPLITEEELFKKIKNSSAYLAIFPYTDKDLISTKFFEIIYTQTPILYIGEEGEVGKFVRDNRLGVHILPENMERDLPKYLSGNVPFENGYFDVKQYTFSNVTQKFLLDLKNFRN